MDSAERRLSADDALIAFWRDERVRVLATLMRTTRGDVDAAEDALAEAVARAAQRWGDEGVPERPGAWILTTARRILIDIARRGGARDVDKDVAERPAPEAIPAGTSADDDRLVLLFACCHPALSDGAQLALALRTFGSLSNRDIAAALLEPETTAAQRLVRATRKLRDAGIVFEMPGAARRSERMPVVRRVLYLLFTTGYRSTDRVEWGRGQLCVEVIRTARLLVAVQADDSETMGVLALMLFHHARRRTRIDGTGAIIPLEEQRRDLWDRGMIDEAEQLLDAAVALNRSGPYQVQAAIAALHATAQTAAETDWAQIALLYGGLRFWWPSPVVELNAAVALAMSRGAEWGLALLDDLEQDPKMQGYHLLAAARADLLRRAGRVDAARNAYAVALTLTEQESERRYLSRRLAECAAACQREHAP